MSAPQSLSPSLVPVSRTAAHPSPTRSPAARIKTRRARTTQMFLRVAMVSFAIGVSIHVASTFHYTHDASVASATGGLLRWQGLQRRRLFARPRVAALDGTPADSQTGALAQSGHVSSSDSTPLSGLPQALREHLAFPGSEVCGTWHARYTALHRRMRAGSVRPKYLTFRPSVTGLGDNLLGLVSSFMAALVSERAFIVADSDLAEAFEPGEIDWRQTSDVPMEVDAVNEGGLREGSVFLLHRMNGGQTLDNMVQLPTDLVQLFSMRLGPAANVIVETNGGILTRVLEEKGLTYRLLARMGLGTPRAFGCILRYLLRPKMEIVEQVRQPLAVVLAPETMSVCIHFRSVDEYVWDTRTGESLSNETRVAELYKEVEEHLLRCAKDVTRFWQKPEEKPTWVFLSDMHGLAELVKLRIGNHVLISQNRPMHPQFQGLAAMASTVADWLLFSACKNYIITESGFSKTSAAFNLNNPRYYLFNRRELDTPLSGSCDASKPNNLTDFRLRSGL